MPTCGICEERFADIGALARHRKEKHSPQREIEVVPMRNEAAPVMAEVTTKAVADTVERLVCERLEQERPIIRAELLAEVQQAEESKLVVSPTQAGYYYVPFDSLPENFQRLINIKTGHFTRVIFEVQYLPEGIRLLHPVKEAGL